MPGNQEAQMPGYRKIILIMTDTQRWDMCGCYRDTGLQTPCIDRLAAAGVRFDRAYTTQPVCQPARAAIFTGQYPHSCASWANSMGISDNALTIGQRLSDNGAHTAYIGKWHLDGGDYFGTGRCPRGWDAAYWYDMRNYLEEIPGDMRLISRTTSYMQDNEFPAEFTFGRRCSDRAVKFLKSHGAEDFFLTVSYDEPHHPYMCPKPYCDMYRGYRFPKSPNVYDTLADKPDYQRVWAGRSLYEDKGALTMEMQYFFGCNAFVDGEIGRVADAAARYAPDALIIYTSDHGDFMHSHSLSGKGPAAYDEITRIPLIFAGAGAYGEAGGTYGGTGTREKTGGIAGANGAADAIKSAGNHADAGSGAYANASANAGRLPRGAVCARPVSHISIAPTVMKLMGYGIPKTMEGADIAALLTNPVQPAGRQNTARSARSADSADCPEPAASDCGDNAPVRADNCVFIEFGRYEVDHDTFGGFQPMRAVFDGRHKLSVNLLSGDELYDLDSDPHEMVNRIADPACAGIRNALHDRLLEHMNDTRDPFRGYYWERRPWRTDARDASWSIGKTRQREEDERYEKRQLDYSTGLEMTDAVREK